MKKYTNRFRESLIVPMRFTFLILLSYFFLRAFGISTSYLGILPRDVFGLIGVITAPLAHGNLSHLMSNIFPVFLLTSLLYFFYDKIADQVFLYCYLVTNLLVWIIGRPYIHIGASGLVYGLATFIVAMGIFRGRFISIVLALLIVFLYGGMIYGILPSNPYISWEAHFSGALTGLLVGLWMSRQRRVSSL